MQGRDRFPLEKVCCHLDGEALPVVNLSLGGFYVATPHPLILGQTVALELLLPDATQISVVGRVAWVNAAESTKTHELPPGFGVEITRISLPDKLVLVTVLRKHSASVPAPPAAPMRPPIAPRG